MKVAVLCGGYSMEREVSLKSGERVYGALKDLGYQALKFDLGEKTISELIKWKPDVVYIALHGKTGEDGVIQEMLEVAGIRFTGPGPLACRLTFDKSIAKEIMEANGIPTARFVSLEASSFKDMGGAELLPAVVEKLGLPLVVKPSSQGSCLGVKLVREESELARGVISALSYDSRVVIEKFLSGTEITVSVLNGEVLPAVEIVPPGEIFDFSAMYTAGETEYYVPARIESDALEEVNRLALKVSELFDCGRLCRIDIRFDNGNPYVLEINTSPGMTATSLLPIAAEAHGMTFSSLVEKIVIAGLEQ